MSITLTSAKIYPRWKKYKTLHWYCYNSTNHCLPFLCLLLLLVITQKLHWTILLWVPYQLFKKSILYMIAFSLWYCSFQTMSNDPNWCFTQCFEAIGINTIIINFPKLCKTNLSLCSMMQILHIDDFVISEASKI